MGVVTSYEAGRIPYKPQVFLNARMDRLRSSGLAGRLSTICRHIVTERGVMESSMD